MSVQELETAVSALPSDELAEFMQWLEQFHAKARSSQPADNAPLPEQPPKTKQPRQGWEAQFQQMAKHGDDRFLDTLPFAPTQWDSTEWEW